MPAAVILTVMHACGAPASEQVTEPEAAHTPAPVQTAEGSQASAAAARRYQIEFVVTPDPAASGAMVELVLRQDTYLLREIDMRAPASRISKVSGNGVVSHENDRVIWQPPPSGGSLRWFAKIDHQRKTGSFDALISPDWAIFRAEDIIPQAASRALRGASGETTLIFELPAGWSSVTEYFGRSDSYRIFNASRRFVRPAGWILLGKIGTRNENIAGVSVKVAAPLNQGMRRMDILALLHWTLPELLQVFPDFPGRLTIIGAADPMWRGGLSGPQSLFVHTERPLLSENATSTLLHEIVHVALGTGAVAGADWIVEGLAEYYSLVVLVRSGTISNERFASSLKKLRDWGEETSKLCAPQSSGPSTARAVTIFAALDKEIQRASRQQSNLDDVIRALAAPGKDITIQDLLAVSSDLLESTPKSLNEDALAGCEL
jgi:hypothetical protein